MANLLQIKQMLDEKNMDVKEFASKIGLSHQGVYKMFAENSTKIETLERISQVLGVPISQFFDIPDKVEEAKENIQQKVDKLDVLIKRLEKVVEKFDK